MEFKEKNVLITGAQRGIGRAIAERFAQEGANLILSDISREVEKTASEIAAAYQVKTLGVVGSASNEDDVKTLFKTISDQFNKIDVCINNAGITRDNLSMRMSTEEFDQVIDVNLRSVFLVSKEAILLMMRAKYGKIINMSSIVGIRGNVGQANYSASKAGIIGLTKSMAAEVAKRGITINAIAPGFIDTDMTRAVQDKARDAFLSMIPMQKAGQVSDIAEAALFFASDRSQYITGQVLVVDGGLMLK